MNTIFIEQFSLLVKQIQAEMLAAQMENDVKEMKMHSYRLKNVRNVLNTIKKLNFEITNTDDIRDLPGFGKGTLDRVTEILETGKLKEIVSISNKVSEIDELKQVIGIGDKLAEKLVNTYKITSVKQLKKAIKKKEYEANEKLLMGLKYHGIVKGNIPRKDISKIEKYLTKQAFKIDSALAIEICGSYRRGKETSGDIDVLMYHPSLKVKSETNDPEKFGFKSYLELFVKKLTKDKFIIDHLTDKDYHTKYMGFCEYKGEVRRIDIRFMPYYSLGTALLYFTGPYELNTAMRSEAKKKNMILNEYGLFKQKKDGELKLIKTLTEEDVFNKLGMKYLAPTEREQFGTARNKF